MTTPATPIEQLSKTTKPLLAALKKLGIETVRDLLLYFPYRYLDFSKVSAVKDLAAGEMVSVKVKIKSIGSRFSFRGRMSLAEAVVSDGTGSIKVTWFNQPYLAKTLRAGDEIFLAGKPDYYNNVLQLTNPIYEKVSDPAYGGAGFPIHTARLVPLYHLAQSVYPKTFRNLIASVIGASDSLADDFPADILSRQNLPDLAQTIRASHFPAGMEDAERARRRLAFEEIFYSQLLAQQHKMRRARAQSFIVKFDQELVKNFLAKLPFQLTSGQKKAAWDILRDLEKPAPMNRLVEGDVGSGKTLVALMAALEVVHNGLQAAFLAPTEILAKQHFETAAAYFANTERRSDGRHFSVCLLTNHYAKINAKDESKTRLQALMEEGMPGLYIGTHALFGKKIKFKNLALVVIDEQHRFGVEQRAALAVGRKKIPHLLSLTATPIPRSLQLAIYGELDISTIKSKPAGRKPIITRLVQQQNRGKAYQFIRGQIRAGRQAFVITPLIEESENSDSKAAKVEAENLKKIFPDMRIGLLHGRMKGAEKEKAMADFLAGRLDVLVSTSAVEVGVDVPNASVMIIEGAERFGLAQLHQFRGRVGRAGHQSYCFLFSESQNPESRARLEAFAKTQDGFALAELDLKQRGFGELYGSEQSGWNFKYFNPSYIALIPAARQEAFNILQKDPELAAHPALKAKIAGKTVHFE